MGTPNANHSTTNAKYYYTRDHLGSVREMTSGGTGTGSTFTLQARYDYDPYGRTTLVSGTNLSDFQYAGMYMHQPSGLNLTLFRAYDPNTARWLSRDLWPDAEISQGPNLYEYVNNDPAVYTDALGLCRGCPPGSHAISFAAASGFPSAMAATASVFSSANSGAAQAWLTGATASGAAGNLPGVMATDIGKAGRQGAAATVVGVGLGELLFYLWLLSHEAGNAVCVPNK